MDGDSCCFIWATSPFFLLLRVCLSQTLFLSPIWISSVRSYLDSFSFAPLSFFLFAPLSVSPFFIFLLWFSCGFLSIQTGLHVILALIPSLLFSSPLILREVIIPFLRLSPIILLFARYLRGLACMHEWTHTQYSRKSRHNDKSKILPSLANPRVRKSL